MFKSFLSFEALVVEFSPVDLHNRGRLLLVAQLVGEDRHLEEFSLWVLAFTKSL